MMNKTALYTLSMSIGIAILLAIIILSVYNFTAKPIAQAQQQLHQRTLTQVIGKDTLYDNDIVTDTLPLSRFQHTELLGIEDSADQLIHIVRSQKKIIAYIVPFATNEGYSGKIELIAGITPDGHILGVRHLSHRETPGLGDKIEIKKSNWILSFNNQSLATTSTTNWQVIKDGGIFEAFTGATITPRAVVKAVYNVLQFIKVQQ